MGLIVVLLLLLCGSLAVSAWLAVQLKHLKLRHHSLKDAYARDMNELNGLRGRRDHAVMVGLHDREQTNQP